MDPSLVLGAATFFKEQVSTEIFLLDTFYGVATVSLFLLVVAVGLIDTGLVQRKNVLDVWIGKLISAMVAGLGMAVVGYAIWQIQFFQAFAIDDPIKEAIKAWWIGGTNTIALPQTLDPALAPENDVFQVFLVFFVAYAMAGGALLHSAGLERVKALPMYIICAFAGTLIIPILLYYTWGSVSPLTKNGVHDYMGSYSLYILVGVWSLIIAWRAGPRIGAFEPVKHPGGILSHRPHNLSLTALGVGLALFCVPFLALGCGYMVPDSGYFGISGTNSGYGLVFINIFMSFMGGAIVGAAISYATKNPIMVLLGPVAGYIGCSASFDVGKPLSMFVVSAIAPFVVYGTYLLMLRLKIDDKKIVPLTLGGGIYAVLVAGIIGNGHVTGGYFGLTGSFEFQNSTINIGHQVVGLAVVLAIAAISGLIVVLGLEKTIGLRVPEKAELEGLDHSYWSAGPTDESEIPAPAPAGGAEPAPSAG